MKAQAKLAAGLDGKASELAARKPVQSGDSTRMAESIATMFRNSKGHWAYVGSEEFKYIAVGISREFDNYYCAVCVSRTNEYEN